MKHFTFRSTLLFFCLTGLLATMSCKKDELDRVKFLGTYSAFEDCSPGQMFTMAITESVTGEAVIVISNFANLGNSVTATVAGSSLTITSQSINFIVNGVAVAVTVVGSGSIIDNNLKITYSWTIPATGDASTCELTCSKQ